MERVKLSEAGWSLVSGESLREIAAKVVKGEERIDESIAGIPGFSSGQFRS